MSKKEKLIHLNKEIYKSKKLKNNKNLKKEKKENIDNQILKIKNEFTEKNFKMISKIEPQKAKGRYNVYINDRFAFGVDEEILIKFRLNKGTHISKDLQNKIEQEDTFYKSYEKVLRYLNYSLRTEKEIVDYLIKNEIEHFQNRIIKKLKENKLIDDANYAKNYISSASTYKLKGPEDIRQTLIKKGISDITIENALEDNYLYEEQLENAVKLAEKRWKRTKNDSQFEAVQKVKYYLMNKGYDFEVINEAIDLIDTEKDDETEYNALEKQADKALRRYQRKYNGYELIQRLRAYLYSKAYPEDLINRYISERDLE